MVVARPAVCLLGDVSHVGEDDGEGDGEGAGHSQKGEVTVSVDLHLKESKHKKVESLGPLANFLLSTTVIQIGTFCCCFMVFQGSSPENKLQEVSSTKL